MQDQTAENIFYPYSGESVDDNHIKLDDGTFSGDFVLMTNNNVDNTSQSNTPEQESFWRYNEGKALKDIKEYIISTYNGHYCGADEYKDLQAIDLIAAKGLAPAFCQSNIIKYSSRYGNKDGRSKRDIMKVIHYAILLLHFDNHYSRFNNGLGEFR